MAKNEYIYIVLIKALTGLGKIGRKLTKYEYTHIAVSLDDKLDDFVSFSRKKHYSPFDAGFMHEKREHYAFGKNEKVKVKIFKVPVTKEDKAKIVDYVQLIENDKDYIFNLYSMLTMPIAHGIKIYKAHNCMSFVGRVIELSNAVELEKEYYKYNIKDIDDLLKKYFFKECYLKRTQEDLEYMKRDGLIFNLKSFLDINGKLIYRILFRGKNVSR
jgi:hypothetical protein